MPRQRTDSADRLSTLQQRLERVQRQIRLETTRQKDQARRNDARRKIIAGALALEHFEKNPDSEFARTMLRLIDEYARPDDRPLFEFLPVRAPSSTPVADAAE